MPGKPVGSQWLKIHFKLGRHQLSHQSYIANNPSVELTSEGHVEQTYGPKYALSQEVPLNHLEFSLKHDDLNLDFLSSVFKRLTSREVEQFIEDRPSGKYSRRIGFLYEFLTGQKLKLTKPVMGNYIDLLDPLKYITGHTRKDQRWRVNNNLPGTKAFCPIVRKTRILKELMEEGIPSKIAKLQKEFPPEIFRRAIQYLYKKETRSSFEIENEKPSADRTEKFIQLLERAGEADSDHLLTEDRLTKLQSVIVDPRFAASGYRDFQNYIGHRVSIDQEVIHYICPPPTIVKSLMEGLQTTHKYTTDKYPEIRSAILSFGFVFIHPFEDGNGRLHRFLIHDLLVNDGLIHKGQIIPVSAHMLHQIKEYDFILENYSKPLMERIQYDKTPSGELIVTNPDQVENYFRYPELTKQCIYLLKTIHATIEQDLPAELLFIQRYDETKKAIQNIVDMPDKDIDRMILFLHQNKGELSKRKRDIFPKLTDVEIGSMELEFRKIFELPESLYDFENLKSIDLKSLQAYLDDKFPNNGKEKSSTETLLKELIDLKLSFKDLINNVNKAGNFVVNVLQKEADTNLKQVGIIRWILYLTENKYWLDYKNKVINSHPEWIKIFENYKSRFSRYLNEN